jgi:hypothetical protein
MRNVLLALGVATAAVGLHLVCSVVLPVPDWAWHDQSGVWQARAFLEAGTMLALGWWWPVPAGLLGGAALAQVISSLIFGSVPNYFVYDFGVDTTHAFNAPDVLLFVGVAAAALTLVWEVGRRVARRDVKA